jgi:hypothetical protein
MINGSLVVLWLLPSWFLINLITPSGITMKKTFQLSHPKIKLPRLVEAIKFEVKKYLKRERNKMLPPDVDFWDFDCKYGADEASSAVIHVSQINNAISSAEDRELKSFYLEILAKPGFRSKKPEDAVGIVPEDAIQHQEEDEINE